ncbi:MAG: PPC domain-containing protein, partial [Chloroflexota bacterium]
MYTHKTLRILIFALCLFLVSIASAQETETYTGEIIGDRDTDEIVITLEEGENVVITATGPFIDTILTLKDPDGDTVAENDDYDFPNTTDSRIAYTAESSGDYTIIVDNFSGSPGEYEVTVEYVSLVRIAVLNGELDDLIGDPDLTFEGELLDDDDTDEYTLELTPEQGVVIDLIAVDSDVMDPV